MTGASPAHNRIATDLSAYLVTSAESCRGFNSDQAIWIESQNRYVCPDLSFVCDDKDKFNRNQFLVNPALLIEVLSEKTEKHDRGPRFSWYCTLPSFQEYILIDSRSMKVEGFYRREDGYWAIQNLYLPEQELTFHTYRHNDFSSANLQEGQSKPRQTIWFFNRGIDILWKISLPQHPR